jgi:hypothetical protein
MRFLKSKKKPTLTLKGFYVSDLARSMGALAHPFGAIYYYDTSTAKKYQRIDQAYLWYIMLTTVLHMILTITTLGVLLQITKILFF